MLMAMVNTNLQPNISSHIKLTFTAVITENRLQAQIIQLQQTVINVLQDALYNNRPLTQADMERLIAAQHAARDGSLDALEGQYSRMLNNKRLLPPQRHQTFNGLGIAAHSSSSGSPPPPLARRVKSLPAPPPRLFCRYAETLQSRPGALSTAFSPSGDGHCPTCGVLLSVDTRDVWVFSTQGGGQTIREYQMDARFVVKCHTCDGRFACVLCNRFRDVDCVCRDVEALVKHLATQHTPDEFERDADLVKIKGGPGSVVGLATGVPAGAGVGREMVLAR
jgi:hypothetical protein